MLNATRLPPTTPRLMAVAPPAHPFWSALFGTDAPVEIEIGSADGSFLLAAARRHPDRLFFGIERSRAKARRLAVRIGAFGSPHVRCLHADATCVVRRLVPAGSVAVYHVYFPDPWPKRRHARRRLFTPTLVAGLARTLHLGGRLHVATDVFGYGRLIRSTVLADPRFEELPLDPAHPGLETAFARKYRRAGRALYTASFRRAGAQPPAAPALSTIRSE